MWNRKFVKTQGKFCFKNNYWYCVLATLLSFILALTGTVIMSPEQRDSLTDEIETVALGNEELVVALGVIFSILGFVILINIIISIFIYNPVKAGLARFFLVNQYRKGDFSEIGYGFTHNYFEMVFGYFLRDILIMIGFLLFFVPGLILCYSYRFVPYILVDDPYISATDALKKSRQMMNGQKWNAFLFDLSFIPWYLLSFITIGFAQLFFVSPYKSNADAQLYCTLKNAYIANYYNQMNNQNFRQNTNYPA